MTEIRAQRRRVRIAAREVLAANDLGSRVRESPAAWLLGAGIAGLLAGRFFARPLAAAGRRRVASAVGSRVREALVSGILAAFGLRSRPGSNGATPREPAPPAGAAASAATSAATGAADPDLSPRT